MRLDELTLERYGAYDQRRLDLTGPGLTVVYGPNEAGKSSCLAAIGDFLFRIPERAALKRPLRSAIFGTDAMRIGATLTAADGRRIALKRRPGRGKTLIDANGAPCDETVLSALLGSTTRDRFEHLFGLDHESLRQGGDRLLEADGEIGRLIVEAGGGLRSLMGRLKSIDDELDSLFAPRRAGARAFYKALDQFETADRLAKANLLTRDNYERDRKGKEAAALVKTNAEAERRQLGQRLLGLQRLVRVIPILRELDQFEAELAGYADVASLTDTFPAAGDKALLDRDQTKMEHDAAQLRHRELSERVAAMPVHQRMADAEVAVRQVEASVTIVATARRDRANRTKELNEAEGHLAGLRQRLRLGPEDDLEALMPAPDALEVVGDLATAANARRTRLVLAREAVAAAEDVAAKTEARVVALVALGRHEPPGLSALSFATLAADWSAARFGFEQAERALAEIEVRAVALGAPDLQALRGLGCPGIEQVRAEIEAEKALATERARASAARKTAQADFDAASTRIEQLRQGGEIATEDALARARITRDEAWRPIRDAHLAGRSTSPDSDRTAEVAALDAGLAHVDRLSDRRTTEAQRVASLVEAERRLEEARRAMALADRMGDEAAQAQEVRRAQFHAAYPDATGMRPVLPALLTLVEMRAALLAKADQAEAARHQAEAARQGLAPRLRQLELAERYAKRVLDADADLSERIQAVTQAIMAHDQGHLAYQRDERDLVAQQATVSATRRTLAGLESEQARWEVDWAQATARIGLTPGTSPEAGAALAKQWLGAPGELRAFAQTRRRLARMDEDEAALAELIETTARPLDLLLPEDALAAGRMLVERWRENNETRLRRDALAPDLEGSAVSMKACETAFVEASARLQALCTGVGATDEAALTALARRQRERAALEGLIAQHSTTASSAGDGLSVSALREAADQQDLDSVRTDAVALEARLTTLDQTIEAAIRDEQQASTLLRAHATPTSDVHAVADRERATADMHAAVERYVDLRLARDLVARAIQRVRNQQQDPLILKAGALLAQMTRGAFEGVATDVDDKGAPVVVGVRPGGRNESVATMSDGTRDQLFLAFRLASLANYCAATEPLPFVADDILVHFDDARGSATLDLLADFCATTQVLLFTHHLGVRDAAEILVRDGRATIVDLGRPG